MLSRSPGLGAATLCLSAVLLAACAGASAPQNATGVRALYRSIGLDASSGEFNDICRSYMDQQLRADFEPSQKNCLSSSFERWAEKIRTAGVGPSTRIVVSGHEALVYRAVKPERAVYIAGQWQLAEVPQTILPRRRGAH